MYIYWTIYLIYESIRYYYYYNYYYYYYNYSYFSEVVNEN